MWVRNTPFLSSWQACSGYSPSPWATLQYHTSSFIFGECCQCSLPLFSPATPLCFLVLHLLHMCSSQLLVSRVTGIHFGFNSLLFFQVSCLIHSFLSPLTFPWLPSRQVCTFTSFGSTWNQNLSPLFTWSFIQGGIPVGHCSGTLVLYTLLCQLPRWYLCLKLAKREWWLDPASALCFTGESWSELLHLLLMDT